MPYTYKAETKVNELAHIFRKQYAISSSTKKIFFQFLAKSIEDIFIKYENNEKKILKLFLKICSKESEQLEELAKEPEEARLIKLYNNDLDIYKHAVDTMSLHQEELENYLKIARAFVFCHFAKLCYDLNEYSNVKNKLTLHRENKKRTPPTILSALNEGKDENVTLQYT